MQFYSCIGSEKRREKPCIKNSISLNNPCIIKNLLYPEKRFPPQGFFFFLQPVTILVRLGLRLVAGIMSRVYYSKQSERVIVTNNRETP